jgi:hypothetical protein
MWERGGLESGRHIKIIVVGNQVKMIVSKTKLMTEGVLRSGWFKYY